MDETLTGVDDRDDGSFLPFCLLDDVDETLTGVDDRDDGSFLPFCLLDDVDETLTGWMIVMTVLSYLSVS